MGLVEEFELNLQLSTRKRPIDGTSILESLEGSKAKRTKPIGFICKP